MAMHGLGRQPAAPLAHYGWALPFPFVLFLRAASLPLSECKIFRAGTGLLQVCVLPGTAGLWDCVWDQTAAIILSLDLLRSLGITS